MTDNKLYVIMPLIVIILGMIFFYSMGRVKGREEVIEYLLYCKDSEFTIIRKGK
jgi:L-lactate permease